MLAPGQGSNKHREHTQKATDTKIAQLQVSVKVSEVMRQITSGNDKHQGAQKHSLEIPHLHMHLLINDSFGRERHKLDLCMHW